jgi:hypothetical protein
MLVRQRKTFRNPFSATSRLWTAALACFLLSFPVAHAQNIYGDHWQNAPWLAVGYSVNLQYRWIVGGTFGSPVWNGCMIQMRTTDGSKVTVAINVSFYNSSNEKGSLHLTDITVNGNRAYGVHAISLNDVEIAQIGHQGCAGVSAVELDNNALSANNNARVANGGKAPPISPTNGPSLTSYEADHSELGGIWERYSISNGTLIVKTEAGTTESIALSKATAYDQYATDVDVMCTDLSYCVHTEGMALTEQSGILLHFRSRDDANAFVRGMKQGGLYK